MTQNQRRTLSIRLEYAKRKLREAKYWLRMIATATPELKEQARQLWQEAKELHLIFNAIRHKIISKNKN